MLTETSIQDILYRYLPSSYLILPNVYCGTHEFDMVRITRDFYMYEYEIKISKTDFLADAHKKRKWQDYGLNVGLTPNYFTYVVPEGLVSAEDCPEFAGLIYVMEGHHGRHKLRVIKRSRKLRQSPLATESVLEIARKAVFRYWNLRLK